MVFEEGVPIALQGWNFKEYQQKLKYQTLQNSVWIYIYRASFISEYNEAFDIAG